MKDSELFELIKRDGLFQTTARLQREAKAKLPPDYTPLCRVKVPKSRLAGEGMTIGDNGRPVRIPNSDPSVHKNSHPIEKPLMVTTVESDLEDEVEQGIDDERELTTIESVVVPAAGEEVPNQIDVEPDVSDEEIPIETSDQSETVEAETEVGAE
jgi:hypothetical protein